MFLFCLLGLGWFAFMAIVTHLTTFPMPTLTHQDCLMLAIFCGICAVIWKDKP
jgi:hypothetical protein